MLVIVFQNVLKPEKKDDGFWDISRIANKILFNCGKKVGEIDFATPLSCFWGYSLFQSLDGICEYS